MYVAVSPSDIYYSQTSISNKFRNGHQIGEVLDDILDGRISHHSLPAINVMKTDGGLVSADNRRLWVLKQLEEHGHVTEINVNIVRRIDRRKCVKNKHVKVRGGGPGGNEYGRMCEKMSRFCF